MDADWHVIFNGLLAVALAAGGWVMKGLSDSITELKKTDGKLADTIAGMNRYMEENFVRSIVLRDGLKPIHEQLNRIEAKLDTKVSQVDCARFHEKLRKDLS